MFDRSTRPKLEKVNIDTVGGDLFGYAELAMVVRAAYLLDWEFTMNIKEAHFADHTDYGECSVMYGPPDEEEFEDYLEMVADVNHKLKRRFMQEEKHYLQGMLPSY